MCKMSEAKKQSPAEWGRELGYWHSPSGKRYDRNGTWLDSYAAASRLHGWGWHEYHYQNDPIQLTEKQFMAAMKATASHPVTPPYGPAVSKAKKRKN